MLLLISSEGVLLRRKRVRLCRTSGDSETFYDFCNSTSNCGARTGQVPSP
jgi:hypothetical protein